MEELERDKEKNTIVLAKKMDFSISREQIDSISLSKEPISILSFMKNINSAIDSETMEKLSSTRITKWLGQCGFLTSSKEPTVIQKTLWKPSTDAWKIGVIEEQVVDARSGEVKVQVKLEEKAQLFILEHMEEILGTT